MDVKLKIKPDNKEFRVATIYILYKSRIIADHIYLKIKSKLILNINLNIDILRSDLVILSKTIVAYILAEGDDVLSTRERIIWYFNYRDILSLYVVTGH